MIQKLRDDSAGLSILALGAHQPILQSILDFDFICGRQKPSVVGVVTSGSKSLKLFFGKKEILVPCYGSLAAAKTAVPQSDFMLNLNSGRRCYESSVEFFETYPDALGGHVFAEETPEQFALKLYHDFAKKQNKFLVGPAGVGLIVPGHLKLGAIGGTDYRQIIASGLHGEGTVAVLSASGGMTNELIRIVANHGKGVSFSMCFGGDRFPFTTPADAFELAEQDPKTEAIVYYGELGGTDEYELVDRTKDGRVTKPVVAFIAGTVGESFEQPIQFGHAKALARTQDETASAKKDAMAAAGITVAGSIRELVDHIAALKVSPAEASEFDTQLLTTRRPSLFSSTISNESAEGYMFLERSLADWAKDGDFVRQIVSALLGKEPQSKELVELARQIFLISIDHGPQVSGALNTIVTARAGKNLVDSLAAGLLTIGPRFGGAVSGAAAAWHEGVTRGIQPRAFIEERAARREYIMGIGHKKYRLDNPDPRQAVLAPFVASLDEHPYLDFASAIAQITVAKKSNLILNIDGFIAAVLLDTLEQKEGYSPDELKALIDIDFFNAFFIIPRTIGFTAHFLDQKRHDEGLFRLPDDAVSFQ